MKNKTEVKLKLQCCSNILNKKLYSLLKRSLKQKYLEVCKIEEKGEKQTRNLNVQIGLP